MNWMHELWRISRTHLILSLVSAVPELEVPMSRRLVLVPSPLAVAGVTSEGPRPGTPEGVSGTICTASRYTGIISRYTVYHHMSLSLLVSVFFRFFVVASVGETLLWSSSLSFRTLSGRGRRHRGCYGRCRWRRRLMHKNNTFWNTFNQNKFIVQSTIVKVTGWSTSGVIDSTEISWTC